MSTLSWVSVGLWIAAGIMSTHPFVRLKYNGQPVKTPLIKIVAFFLATPLFGIFIFLGGLVSLFIGLLLAAPLVELVSPAWWPFKII